jgi:3-oxoacyl-[acyl-carrier-protein] synthase II
MAQAREIWITGIGLISSLGEGLDAHMQRLREGNVPVTDRTLFPPYLLHPLAKIDFDKQIPKKGDQRQMEPWQRIGTYAAGLALADAGIAGKTEILQKTDMIVAAAGGERDAAVDMAILTDIRQSNDPDALLNARLQSDLRPTLFLAQLSNLLAGNISIVHGVVGSSRTFMGEEGAGVSAVEVARARIATGQSEIALVGGAYNAERHDTLLIHMFDQLCYKGDFMSVFAPKRPNGFALGSMGVFLVLESGPHAGARGARPIARLGDVQSSNTRREPGAVKAALQKFLAKAREKMDPSAAAIVSGANGAEPATAEEAEALAKTGLPVRAIASRFGHGVEAVFPLGIAIAALAVREGRLFAPMPNVPLEQKTVSSLRQAIVTCVGHWQGEGLGIVEAVQ